MKLSNCRESYYYNSGKASDVCRNLGFAGLALIWAFRVTKGNEMIIPNDLRWAGVFLVAGLIFDFLQYVIGTIIWGAYHRFKEKRTSEKEEFLAPAWINYPADGCFILKQISISIAYIFLLMSMFSSFWK